MFPLNVVVSCWLILATWEAEISFVINKVLSYSFYFFLIVEGNRNPH